MRIELETEESKAAKEPQVIKPKTENIGDEIKEQRKLLKGQGPKAYLTYFLDYYKWPVIAGAAALIAVISVVRTQMSYTEPEITAYVLNASSVTEDISGITDDFIEKQQLDLSSDQVELETTLVRTTGTASTEVDTAVQVKIMALSTSASLDVLIADAWNFNYYAESSAFADLREKLGEDVLQSYEGKIFYVDRKAIETLESEQNDVGYEAPYVSAEEGRAYEVLENFTLPDPDTMADPIPVGIMLNGSEVVEKYGMYEDTACIFGFMGTASAEHEELSLKLLDYFTS